MLLTRLSSRLHFPSPSKAREDGLLAYGGDLSPERLLLAYRHGIFPWYSLGEPILWWSPDPRCVLYVNELHISRSMQKLLRQGRYEFSLNSAFSQVIRACAQTPRKEHSGTWIDEHMIQAYEHLHQLGYAHSAEVWQDGQLAGGIYGVSLQSMFYGESMFSLRPNASKAALIALLQHLGRMGFRLMDVQLSNPHLLSLGAREIPRQQFLLELQLALARPAPKDCWPEPGPPGLQT